MDYVWLVIVAGLVMLYMICHFAAGPKTTLPSFKRSQYIQQFFYILSLYRQSTNSAPFLCQYFQALCGCCKIFSREKIFQIEFGFKSYLFLFKPETVEEVLRSTKHIEKSNQYKFLIPWLGTGLLTSSGQKWHSRRKLLSPSFHFKILEEFLTVFNEQSILLADKLEGASGAPWVDVVPFFTSCALDIICQTAMGVRNNAQAGGCKDYVQALHELDEILYYRALRLWLHVDWIFGLTPSGRRFMHNVRIVKDFTKKVIREKKAEMTATPAAKETDGSSHRQKNRSLLQLLLENHLQNPSFNEEDIQEEVDTIVLAGHDTTAMALSWSVYMIGLHEEIQKMIHEELDDIFGDDVRRAITRQDLTRMKYLECVIKETLRLYPSVMFFARKVENQLHILDHKVRSGSVCIIFPYMLHKDPENFPDPEKFIPERFFPENCIKRHSFAYIPFSAGPRNCIGQKYALMEMKTVLANVLRRFHVTSLDPRDKVNVSPHLVLKNVQPLRLKFTQRRLC